MLPGGDPFCQSPAAVIVDRAHLRAGRILPIAFVFAVLQGRGIQEWHALVQNGEVAGPLHILGSHIGQPEQVIGNARADAARSRGMPPVQHIAGFELAAGGA